MCGKLLSGITSMYVDSLTCVRVKGSRELFRIYSGVRHGCIKSPWLFIVYGNAVMKVKMGMGRKGARFLEEERVEIIWPLVCRSRDSVWQVEGGLKVNAGKSKMMVLNGEEGVECEVYVGRIRLEHVSEHKYLAYVLDESQTG